MNEPSKVSIVIPCFNHGEFLPEAIASVERSGAEIIVVDDGSTDVRTRSEMDALTAHGIRVIRQENKGLSAARNAGIRASSGQYIFPLDADDRARPDSIENAIPILDASAKTGVVYGDVQFVGTRTDRWSAGPFEPARLMQANFIASSALFRRTVWEQNSGYDERMKQGFEDWEFWINAHEHGWQFTHVPEVLFEYRQRENSMLTQARKVEASVAEYIATKHAALYRREWQHLALERDSGKGTLRNLSRIVKTRIKQKLGINGNHAK